MKETMFFTGMKWKMCLLNFHAFFTYDLVCRMMLDAILNFYTCSLRLSFVVVVYWLVYHVLRVAFDPWDEAQNRQNRFNVVISFTVLRIIEDRSLTKGKILVPALQDRLGSRRTSLDSTIYALVLPRSVGCTRYVAMRVVCLKWEFRRDVRLSHIRITKMH